MKEKSESAPPRGRRRATSILMANADRNRMTAGTSNLPLTNQRFRANELVSGKAPFCLGVEKSAPKADEPKLGQRHKEVEGKGKPLH